MTRHSEDRTVLDLKNILSEEKAFLMSGRAHDAAALVEDKMNAIRAFDLVYGSMDGAHVPIPQRREIELIIEMANENSSHFLAVCNGLRSVISRIETQHANAYVGSYSQDGEQVPFMEATGQYQKKV